MEVKIAVKSETTLLSANSNVHDINVISNECANVNNKKDNHDLIHIFIDQNEFLKKEL